MDDFGIPDRDMFHDRERPQVRPHITVYAIYSFIDIMLNVCAGLAAVSAGAHANGTQVTTQMLQLGALAGLTKSGILSFVGFLGYSDLPTTASIIFMIFSSGFGIGVFITAEISNLVLGNAPESLLLAAVWAAIPLYPQLTQQVIAPEQLWVVCCDINCIYCCIPCCLPLAMFWPSRSLLLIPLNAIGGNVFARVAASRGFILCSPSTAARAGAAYGAITGITSMLISLFHMQGFHPVIWFNRRPVDSQDEEASRPLLQPRTEPNMIAATVETDGIASGEESQSIELQTVIRAHGQSS